MKPGIYHDLDEKVYHADQDSTSKSALWMLWSKTPLHMKVEKTRTNAMDLGSAFHVAVLQPHLLKDKIMRGTVDRRGNKWKEIKEEAESTGRIPLIEKDFDELSVVQKAAWEHPVIKKIAEDSDVLFEASAFWKDPETGLIVRCRPDIYSGRRKVIVDLKSGADVSQWNWSKNAGNLGYHVQEAIYSEGWTLAGGGDVDGFLFVAIEQTPPYATAVYELDPSAVTEGHAVYHAALRRYKNCVENDDWPGYSTEIQPIDIPPFSYSETEAPGRGL